MMHYVDYICAILVKIFSLVFYAVPLRLTLWLAGMISRLVYTVNVSRRVICYANLRAAYFKDKSPRQLKRLTRKTYKSLVRTFFEILSLRKVNADYVSKYVEIVNLDNMMKIKDHPNGVILLTAHFGNWELSGMVSAIKGFPLYVLAREQKMKKLNELINRLRQSKGLTVVTKGATTKYIVKALHQGKMIGMVGDQDAGKAGILVPFFGRLVSTAPGSMRIAARTGAYVLPAFIARVKGPYHRLILESPMKIERGDEIKPYLERYNRLLEKYVTIYPDQWLWLHKRWKSTPLKRVIILSDGKPGHLNQAKAFCKELTRYRVDFGYEARDTEVSIIDVKFRNVFAKALVNFLSIFACKSCQGCMRCLKFCMTKESYEDLVGRHANIVVSCGSGVAGVNRIFSIENSAKSAVVMKPPMIGLGKFDMVVLPWHDARGNEGENVIVTDTVPNLIDEEYLALSRQRILGQVSSDRPKRLGVLLGGDNSDFKLTHEIVDRLLSNVISAANKLDADLLFTTSRRTPKWAEKMVKETLRSEKRCKFLVLSNENNVPHAVGGILGLSDIVVVSGESASMVSEAIFSGKPVVTFALKRARRGGSKLERMLTRLKEKGYVSIANTEKLSDAICESYQNTADRKIPQDRHDVYKYMWRVL
ncbi:MAG: ELM1/GtrOC1 family putative glycosyltransferase [Candidatus Omnitrophota bacterium]